MKTTLKSETYYDERTMFIATINPKFFSSGHPRAFLPREFPFFEKSNLHSSDRITASILRRIFFDLIGTKIIFLSLFSGQIFYQFFFPKYLWKIRYLSSFNSSPTNLLFIINPVLYILY